MTHDDEQHPTERLVDETVAESFPASDPPFWTLGVEEAATEAEPEAEGPQGDRDAATPGPKPPAGEGRAGDR